MRPSYRLQAGGDTGLYPQGSSPHGSPPSNIIIVQGYPTPISGTTADGANGAAIVTGATNQVGIAYSTINGQQAYVFGDSADPTFSGIYWMGTAWNMTVEGESLLPGVGGTFPWEAVWTTVTVTQSPGLTVNFTTPLVAGDAVLAFISYGGIDEVEVALVGGGAEDVDTVVAQTGPGTHPAFTTQIKAAFNVTGGETGITYATTTPIRASMQILVVRGLANAVAFATSADSGTATVLSTGDIDNTGHDISLIVGVIASNQSDLANMTSLTGIGVIGGDAVYQTAGFTVTGVTDDYQGGSTSTSGDYAGAIAGFDPA